LKIAHILQFLGVGGLEKVLFLLIKEQQKAGHDITVYVYDYEQSWVQKYLNAGIKVSTKIKKKDGLDLMLIPKFAKELKHFDIIHSHDLNPLIYTGILKVFFIITLTKQPKFIHTTHGMEHIKYTPKTKFYEYIFARLTDGIITVSQNYFDFYKSIGVKLKKIHNIDNGIDVPKELASTPCPEYRNFLLQKYNINPEKKLWCTLARVVPLKDQKLLILLAAKRPDVSLLIIGPSGNEEYWNELLSMKIENVIFCDAQENINDYLKGCDLFLSASHHEGLPISVLEAGAMGLPCVLSDIPGHRVLQRNEKEEIAVFFQLKSLDDLVNVVEDLESNPEKQKLFKKNLFNNITKFYSAQTMYNKVQKVYQVAKC
jgi:glycosyltransferase involved in cell wall biosynthesis